jgi:hypothetical protein
MSFGHSGQNPGPNFFDQCSRSIFDGGGSAFGKWEAILFFEAMQACHEFVAGQN